MLSPEERLRTIREQVDSKIKWGDSRDSVAAWLAQKHGIMGEEADRMLHHAFQARHTALRERAMIRLLISIVGLLVSGIWMYIRVGSGIDILSGRALIGTLFLAAIGLVSLTTLFRSLAHIMGKDEHVPLD
jgi:hypothetical protein